MSARSPRSAKRTGTGTHPSPPTRTSPFLSSGLSLLLAGLFSLLLVYLTAWDLIRTELEKDYGLTLPRNLAELRAVNWSNVGQQAVRVLNPKEAYLRGQGYGVLLRMKGAEAVKQLRERYEL